MYKICYDAPFLIADFFDFLFVRVTRKNPERANNRTRPEAKNENRNHKKVPRCKLSGG
ncbi:MAG: hypothetical protein P4L53_17230 [Candidatus Obscuribacterales bacterium]|nr:hypothetical protein [Candidatus Obscuribacterales bacterium]